jgi:protein arginine kinase
MRIRDMIDRPAAWLDASGEESEIVLSTRVRLARNIDNTRFPHNCSKEELAAVLDRTRQAVEDTRGLRRGHYFAMGSASSTDRQFLAERHLISRELLFNSSSRGLIVNDREDLCVMINEEDHLRIQGYRSGFDIAGAFDRVNQLDTQLADGIGFAFNERLGYLTACPTNLGTGMRASLLIHLPGLVHSKEINRLLDSLRQLNHSIRGLYGEGSEVMGNLFQLSNSATLGTAEDDIVAGLREMVNKVVGFEHRSRDMLLRKARSLLEDKVWRAFGLLSHARSVSTKEALSLISAVRMGVGMEIIDRPSLPALNQLLVDIQPAHIQVRHGSALDSNERDMTRAELIRSVMTGSSDTEQEE